MPGIVTSGLGTYCRLVTWGLGPEEFPFYPTDTILKKLGIGEPFAVDVKLKQFVPTEGFSIDVILKSLMEIIPEEIYKTHFLSFPESYIYLAKNLVISQDGHIYLRLSNGVMILIS
jgi:hypothetical protein